MLCKADQYVDLNSWRPLDKRFDKNYKIEAADIDLVTDDT